jgi:hypothetical protein
MFGWKFSKQGSSNILLEDLNPKPLAQQELESLGRHDRCIYVKFLPVFPHF